jgi:hypothetical protein
MAITWTIERALPGDLNQACAAAWRKGAFTGDHRPRLIA